MQIKAEELELFFLNKTVKIPVQYFFKYFYFPHLPQLRFLS